MEVIKDKDISVVVQGQVENSITQKCLLSIRKYLPNAEIILSTWNNCVTEGLEYDILVKSEDPGAEFFETCKNPKQYNLNRILLSSQVGLEKVNRKYILKCRTDCEVVGNGFLESLGKYNKRDEKYALSKERIAVGAIYSHKYQRQDGYMHPTPFYVTDWYCFGLKEDIRLFYDIPLVNTHEFARYFELHKKKHNYSINWMNRRLWRFPPEQYICVCFAKKKYPELEFEDCLSYELVDIKFSEKFLINNFVILNPVDYGIIINKWPYSDCSRRIWEVNPHSFDGMYRTYVYEKLYKKYCDSKFKLSSRKDFDKIKRKKWMKQNGLKSHYKYKIERVINHIMQ